MSATEVREWIDSAEHDFGTAKLLLREGVYPDVVVYHMHQCIEKLLKALIVKNGQPLEKTHALDRLLVELTPGYPKLDTLRNSLMKIHNYLPKVRYPYGEQIDLSQATELNQHFEMLREMLLEFALG